MEKITEFDDIRPYHDEELPQVYEELIADPEFRKMVEHQFPIPFEVFSDQMRQCSTKYEFQKKLGSQYLREIARKTTDGIKLDDSSLSGEDRAYTYISNHRDIVLDSGFLSVLLLDGGMDTVEIAIGDNLLFLPWIKKVVRINKSFIVQRALNMRQILDSSARLSRYMHYAINEKKESLWIAQREGRAKDSNDRTQESLLKMLAMGGEGDIIDRLSSLHIAPLSISYEYDPCDYLKAKEFQLKRDVEGYKKTFQDDLKNMETGILGYKGKVEFRTGKPLNDQLEKIDRNKPKQEIFTEVASLIDKEIHRNYTIFPCDWIAYDMLKGEKRFEKQYTVKQKNDFESYLKQQLDKIDIENKDIPFLTERMLTMYANPLINQMAVIG